jgi:hypothetical protein
MQALGYRTEGLADAQTVNFKANAIQQKVIQEKNRLINRIDLELTRGDDEAFDTALNSLLNFYSRNPSALNDTDEAKLSTLLSKRLEAREAANRGFRVDENFYPYLEVLLEPSRAKLERESAKAKK